MEVQPSSVLGDDYSPRWRQRSGGQGLESDVAAEMYVGKTHARLLRSGSVHLEVSKGTKATTHAAAVQRRVQVDLGPSRQSGAVTVTAPRRHYNDAFRDSSKQLSVYKVPAETSSNDISLNSEEARMARLLEYDRKLGLSLYRAGEYVDHEEQEEKLVWATNSDENSSSLAGTSRGASKNKHLRWFKNNATKRNSQSVERTSMQTLEERINRFVYRPRINLAEERTPTAASIGAAVQRGEKDDSIDLEANEIDSLGMLSDPYDFLHRRRGYAVQNDKAGEKQQQEEEEETKSDDGAGDMTKDKEQKAAQEQRVRLAQDALLLAAKERETLESLSRSKEEALGAKLLALAKQNAALQAERENLLQAAQAARRDSEQAKAKISTLEDSHEKEMERILRERQESEWTKKLVRGGVFIRHKGGTTSKSLVYCDRDLRHIFYANMSKLFGRVSHTSIPMSAVTRVAHGIKTETLKRTGVSERVYSYLSLVGNDFSLDLELPYYPKDVPDRDRLIQEHRSEWLAAFRFAVAKAAEGTAEGEPNLGRE